MNMLHRNTTTEICVGVGQDDCADIDAAAVVELARPRLCERFPSATVEIEAVPGASSYGRYGENGSLNPEPVREIINQAWAELCRKTRIA
jgi:hypothetical protein